MDKQLLDILCCPTTHVPVRPLTDAELAALNRAIASGPVRNGAGAAVASPFSAGLITRDRHTIYRIDDDIPVMLADEAVSTAQLEDFPDR